ncbi:MAG: hypothetical protein KME63_18765, partial [Candidatus Thiodiazotropha sp. (ex Clathrolucina costata)]|nr:hypothetical protein [Candidatus Thiodiazotropha taylori]
RPFRNPSYIDYLVGWRYLLNRHYRSHVQNRWSDQFWFISASEMLAGLGSVLFSTALAAILMFVIWEVWFD